MPGLNNQAKNAGRRQRRAGSLRYPRRHQHCRQLSQPAGKRSNDEQPDPERADLPDHVTWPAAQQEHPAKS